MTVFRNKICQNNINTMETKKVNVFKIMVLLTVLSSSAAAAQTQKLPVFTDVTKAAGITIKHSYGDFNLTNIVEGTGSGAMFFDYNNDGWLDIYFLNGCWLKNVNDNIGRKLR